MKSILLAFAGVMLLLTLVYKPEKAKPMPLPEYREVWEDVEVEIVSLDRSKKRTSVPWDMIEVQVRYDALDLEDTFSAQFSGNKLPDWDSWKIGDHIPAKMFTLINEQTGEIKQQVIARIF